MNNAGILYVMGKPTVRKLFQEFKEDENYSEELNVTLYGTLNCTRSVLQTMLKKKSGTIINIVSDAGRTEVAGPGSTIYGAGKGGIIAFSKNLAVEVASSGIRVNCVSPGLIKTTRAENAESNAQQESETTVYYQKMKEGLKRVPMGRMGMSQEVANVVVFLASNAASFITGQTLSVNGGARMV